MLLVSSTARAARSPGTEFEYCYSSRHCTIASLNHLLLVSTSLACHSSPITTVSRFAPHIESRATGEELAEDDDRYSDDDVRSDGEYSAEQMDAPLSPTSAAWALSVRNLCESAAANGLDDPQVAEFEYLDFRPMITRAEENAEDAAAENAAGGGASVDSPGEYSDDDLALQEASYAQ